MTISCSHTSVWLVRGSKSLWHLACIAVVLAGSLRASAECQARGGVINVGDCMTPLANEPVFCATPSQDDRAFARAIAVLQRTTTKGTIVVPARTFFLNCTVTLPHDFELVGNGMASILEDARSDSDPTAACGNRTTGARPTLNPTAANAPSPSPLVELEYPGGQRVERLRLRRTGYATCDAPDHNGANPSLKWLLAFGRVGIRVLGPNTQSASAVPHPIFLSLLNIESFDDAVRLEDGAGPGFTDHLILRLNNTGLRVTSRASGSPRLWVHRYLYSKDNYLWGAELHGRDTHKFIGGYIESNTNGGIFVTDCHDCSVVGTYFENDVFAYNATDTYSATVGGVAVCQTNTNPGEACNAPGTKFTKVVAPIVLAPSQNGAVAGFTVDTAHFGSNSGVITVALDGDAELPPAVALNGYILRLRGEQPNTPLVMVYASADATSHISDHIVSITDGIGTAIPAPLSAKIDFEKNSAFYGFYNPRELKHLGQAGTAWSNWNAIRDTAGRNLWIGEDPRHVDRSVTPLSLGASPTHAIQYQTQYFDHGTSVSAGGIGIGTTPPSDVPLAVGGMLRIRPSTLDYSSTCTVGTLFVGRLPGTSSQSLLLCVKEGGSSKVVKVRTTPTAP